MRSGSPSDEEHDRTAADQRARLATDHHRPRYHFLPPANWMNDPNGFSQWGGTYHLFYQHNPVHPYHEVRCVWGHASSTNLVDWVDHPIALSPGADADAAGCWTGCVVDDGGTPVAVYTGVPSGRIETTCVAHGSADLSTFTGIPENPVIAAPPDGLEVTGFRDHSVWRDGDRWYMIVGSGLEGVGGAALLYSSPDLRQWVYHHPLLVSDLTEIAPLWLGEMWECVDFFPVGHGKHALIVGVCSPGEVFTFHYNAYLVGTYENLRFTPEHVDYLDHGGHQALLHAYGHDRDRAPALGMNGAAYYSAQTLRDDRGRRIVVGWLGEDRPRDVMVAAGWGGICALPRALSLRPDGRLSVQPVDTVADLVTDTEVLPPECTEPGGSTTLRGGVGQQYLVELALDWCARPGVVAVDVLADPTGRERTAVTIDLTRALAFVDRSRADLDSASPSVKSAPIVRDADTLTVKIFVDHSIVEVFAGDTSAVSVRVYPSEDAVDLRLRTPVAARAAAVRTITLHRMRSVWP